MKRNRISVCLAVFAAAGIAGADHAVAQSNEAAMEQEVANTSLSSDQIMFIVRSAHPNIVDLEFYSDGRNRAWPGGGQVYSVDDYDWHSYVLDCDAGESICYGAGVRNDYDTYWGVGIDERANCSNCCFVCNGTHTSWITLNE